MEGEGVSGSPDPEEEAFVLRWYRPILVVLIAFGIVSGLPDLVRRVSAERADRYVELVADQASWQQLAASVGQTPEQVLSALHAVGVQGLGVSEDTLQSLDALGLATVLSGNQWLDALRASGSPAPPSINPAATYALLDGPALAAFVQTGLASASGLPVQTLALPGGRLAIGVPLAENLAEALPLGFRPPSPGDAGAFGLATALGMDVVPRPESGPNPMGPGAIGALFDQIAAAGVPVHSVLFAGTSTQPVPGYPSALPATASALEAHGWNLAVIETPAQRGNVDQPGTLQINDAMGQRTVRTYSVPPWMLQQYTESQTATAILTSVEERNLRVVYLHPYQVGADLEARTVALYADVVDQLQAHGYDVAPPHPFPSVVVPTVQRALQAVAVAAAGLWLLEVLFPALRRYGYAPLAVIGVLAALFGAGSHHLTQLLVPLAAASVFGGLSMCYLAGLWERWRAGALDADAASAPVGEGDPAPAVRPAAGGGGGAVAVEVRSPAPAGPAPTFGWVWRRAALASLAAAGISFLGALIIATLLGDTTHFLEWQYFHGIKVTYLGIPLLAACAFAALVGFGAPRRSAQAGLVPQVRWLGEQPLLYKHVALMLVVAAIGAIYLLRSGNVGAAYVPAIEEHMRNFLERAVVARPREKEFLVGYPSLFLAMVGLARRWRWWFLFFLLGASVGQVSLIDTFEHLRTPFQLSVERSALGLIGGALIGTVALAVVWPATAAYERWRASRGGGAGPKAGDAAWPGS